MSMILSVGLSYIALIMSKYVPSMPTLLRVFIIIRCWILWNAFSASMETVHFLWFVCKYEYHVYWFVEVEQALHPWNKSHLMIMIILSFFFLFIFLFILISYVVEFSLAFQEALVLKNLPANAGDTREEGSKPRPGRSPGRGHSNALQYFYLENPMDRGALWATVHRVTKSCA